jgi:hypothetical protein
MITASEGEQTACMQVIGGPADSAGELITETSRTGRKRLRATGNGAGTRHFGDHKRRNDAPENA